MISTFLEWFVTFSLIVGLVKYIQYKWNRRKIETYAAQLPGLPSHWFIGNLFYFIGVTHEEFIYKVDQVMKQFSDGIIRIWLGPQLVIGVYNPDDVNIILSNSKIIDKGLLFTFFQPRSKGAFTLSGETWRKKRKLANKLFHHKLFKNYNRVMNQQGYMIVKHFGNYVNSGTFDVSHAFCRCTLDTICKNGLGVKTELQEDESVTFPEDLTKSSNIMIQRGYSPWLFPTFIFNMTKLGKEMNKYVRNIHQFTISVIKMRKQILEENQSQNYIKYEDNNSNESKRDFEPAPYVDELIKNGEQERLSDLDLALEALDIVIGGVDTSAIADSYVLVMLGIYKDWQKKVHEELDLIFGDSNRSVTDEDCEHMVYLDMVIKEVLRLYTAPHTVRYLNEDVKLTNYTLPSGSIIYISIYAVHRIKEYWSHPNEFHPDHFLPENVAVRPKNVYIPFSKGPRGCPGAKYGTMSIKIILAHVLRNFEVECDLKFEDLRYKPSLMLELDGGYPIRLIPRNRRS